MDSFEINKILGAVLATCLGLLSLNIAANAIFAPHKPAKPGYEIAVTEQPAAGGGPAAPAVADDPLPKRLASADAGRNTVGPNLWGIVGRPKAAVAGFNYSAAMKAKGGNWTPEELDQYLQNPKAMVPGTNMNFAGIPRGSERADLITFLNGKSDNPAQLPKAADAGSAAQHAGIAAR
jgi:cytochrome c